MCVFVMSGLDRLSGRLAMSYDWASICAGWDEMSRACLGASGGAVLVQEENNDHLRANCRDHLWANWAICALAGWG